MAYHHWGQPWPDVATGPEEQYIVARDIPTGDERLTAYQALLARRSGFLDRAIDPGLFELAPKAEVTDMLTKLVQPPRTMVISDRLKEILMGFDIFDHRLHPLQIRDDAGKVLKYWLLEWRDDVVEHVDFARSRFSKMDLFLRTPTVPLPLGSLSEYQERLRTINKEAPQSHWTIRADRIVFATMDWRGQDMFDLGSLSRIVQRGPIISDRLLGALLDAGITGVQFSRADHIIAP